ncbi:MAG: YihY/virulence factor BrkB family protein [Dehalococcoidia bacterium]
MTARRLLTVVEVIKGAVNEFLADNCPHLAAAVSFYLLLSLFPLVLVAISIFGFIMKDPSAAAKVTEAITGFIPVSTDFVEGTLLAVSRSWGAAGIIATVGLIWAGMAVFNAIRKSLNTAWGVRQPRPFFHERLMEFLMMIGLGALMLMSLGLTTAFKVIREASLPVFGERLMDGSLVWHSAVIATSVFITFLGVLFLYKLVPNTKVHWRHAAIGALAAAVLFEIVKNVFVWFVANFATYSLVYGSVGVIIALMTWAYISVVILLFCAKLTSVYPRVRPALATEALAEETTKEKLLRLAPLPPVIFGNMSSLTSGGVGALRRLMLGKG